MAMRFPTRCLVVLAVPTFLSACFGYYPHPQPAGLVGKDVLLTLTDSGSVVLASRLGPSITEVFGRLDSDSASAFGVSVISVRNRGGLETDWKGERVAISRPLVAAVAERRFSRARTTALGAILGVALYAVREAFQGTGGGFGAPSPSGPVGGR